MKKSLFIVLLGLFISFFSCASSLVILNNEIIHKYGFTDNDLKKYVYRTNGEVIFYRMADSFDGSLKSASRGTIRKQSVNNQFYERIVLQHNTDGFYHHRTDTHIFIQIKSGDYILPFNLSTGQLETQNIIIDGKQYDYEEGKATLMFTLPKGVEK